MKRNELISKFRYLIKVIIWIFIFIIPASIASGQEQLTPTGTETTGSVKKKFALFDSEELLDISLEFDLGTFLRKHPKTGYQNATLKIYISENDTIDRKIRIRPRGEYRQKVCSFPPIMLNFKKLFPAYSDTGSINKLKLVTHCQPGKSSDENVHREYLVYKLFNVLTDTSFRVRLLKINYLDVTGKRKPVTQSGFFIEPVEVMALRTNSTVVKATNLTQKHIASANMNRVAIFFYMISQWDWSVPGLHNVAVLMPMNPDHSGLGIAVPYDFDLTGIVNPGYGFPDEKMGIKSNRDRLFSGICRSREEFAKALEEFRDHKETFYSVINDFQYLDQKAKKDITGFLDQFFNQLDNQKDVERLIGLFLKSCKTL